MKPPRHSACAAFALSHCIVACVFAAEPDAEGVAFFESKIRPILAEHCYECHSAQSAPPEGGLRLDSRPGWHKGGTMGAAVIPREPDDSLLVKAVRYDDDDLQMPPDGKLSEQQIADLVEWVKRGAPDPRTDAAASVSRKPDIAEARTQWPYTPPTEPAIPAVRNTRWPRGDIDRFVLAKVEERGLAPAADADKRTLIRRATFDLTGLPPTPEEVDAFLADESAEAFAHVVDRLLASSHYGERWGRHWLDVVRYADTAGDNSDYPIPQLYKYRNWVIDALNRDLPYDQFIRAQIAGDLLPADGDEQRRQQIIATGYLANARRFGSRVADYPQHLTIEDTIDNLGRAFLGQTVNCARCHDHKFDPITARDYYALYGIFHSTRYPWPGIELDKVPRELVPLVPAEEAAAALHERDAKRKAFDDEIKRLEKEKREAGDDRKKELDKQIQRKKHERETLQKSPLPFETAYAVAEAAKVENVRLQLKGDPEKPGDEVPRRFLEVLGGQPLPQDAGSGRLALAGWIASPENPLTARVMVNRIWQHHFGRGLVATPNDFGRQGQRPTHPELLDWLALRFVENGWSIKSMHRLIMLSRTYQLSSRESDGGELASVAAAAVSQKHDASDADPNNELLSHFRRRRLDAESIRDALLAVSGRLDRTPGGPHPFPDQATWDFTQHKPFRALYETDRRSVYLMTQRIQRHPYLAIFDGPDTGASTGARITSTTSLQALYLLNDEFVHEQAGHLAGRLISERSTDAERIDRAYALLFSRPPAATEREAGLSFLNQIRDRLAASGTPDERRAAQAWSSYARALLRTSEFVYVD